MQREIFLGIILCLNLLFTFIAFFMAWNAHARISELKEEYDSHTKDIFNKEKDSKINKTS